MKTISTLLLLLIGGGLFAQEAPGLRDIIVDSASYVPVSRYRSVGISYRMSRDEVLSPLVFQGIGFSYSTSTWKYRKEWLWQTNFATHSYLMENEPASSLLSEIGFSYKVAALRELTSLERGQWRFWFGPEAGMFLHTRLHSQNVNNVASYDWATSLGISGMVSSRFRLWGRSFAISNQLQLPLAFVYARPPYAWSIPPTIFEEQDGSWKDAFQLGTLNNIFLISNQLNLDFYLRKRKKGKLLQYNAYRLAYVWSYFQINTRNKLQTGGHQLNISRVITF